MLQKQELTTAILESVQTHSHNTLKPGQDGLKIWCNYWYTSFNHMQLALYWPRGICQTHRHLDNDMLLIPQLAALIHPCTHRAGLGQCIITRPSRIDKLRGLDPAPLWLVLNPSKCWGKTKPAAVTDMKRQRMMSLQKMCYICSFHFHGVQKDPAIESDLKVYLWNPASRRVCFRPPCAFRVSANLCGSDVRACVFL